MRIWDWQRGALLQLLQHPAPVKAALFDPSGRLVATVCDDGAASGDAGESTTPIDTASHRLVFAV